MDKHLITPDLDDALKQFAARLPVPEVKYRAPVPGAQLLADTPGISGPNGEPIDPLKLYYVGSGVNAANHLRQMRKAFRQGGRPALVQYLVPYAEFLKTE